MILLLFTIGLEFSLEKLSRIGRAIFVGGDAGDPQHRHRRWALLAFDVKWQAGVYTGCLVALSSTAIVLGLLAERDETDTPTGSLSLAILIFQDLAVVVMVLLVPFLAGEGGTLRGVLWVLGKALLLIAVVLVLARRVVPWMLEHIAHTRRRSCFCLTVVAICFGTAGVSRLRRVSLPLGAFLAGLVVRRERYSDQAMSEILPLRTIFNAVFFVSVGMLLNLGILARITCSCLRRQALSSSSSSDDDRQCTRARLSDPNSRGPPDWPWLRSASSRSCWSAPGGPPDCRRPAWVKPVPRPLSRRLFSSCCSLRSRYRVAHRFGAFLSVHPFGGWVLLQSSRRVEDTGHFEDHVIIVAMGRQDDGSCRCCRIAGFLRRHRDESGLRQRDAPTGRACHLRRCLAAPYPGTACVEAAKLCVVVINRSGHCPAHYSPGSLPESHLQIIVRTRHLANVERLQQIGADIIVPEEMETTARIFSHVLGPT